MRRKKFLKSLGMASLASVTGLRGFAGEHNQLANSNRSFLDGPGIPAGERLYQGPFPVYRGSGLPDSIDDWSVVMTTAPSDRILNSNFGMGVLTYVIDEAGPPKVKGETLRESIEKLVRLPFGQKIYMRVNWKDLQKEPGKLSSSEAWNITMDLARKYNKRVAFRVMMQNPNIPGLALPDFVAKKIHFTDLGNKLGKENMTGGLADKAQTMPDFADPVFQDLWKSFNELLAEQYNDNSEIEFMDTYMYGFWGEGHNWPIEKISFPDHITAVDTFQQMLFHQLKLWDKTPLLTNTQPDFNHVGNDSLLQETLRTNNWLRTDTIFIENQQIDELSNRYPWIGAAVEVGMFRDENMANVHFDSYKQTPTENIIRHAIDVGANYCSLWNWQHINADVISRYYEKYPEAIDQLIRTIGYRIRPSFVWIIQMSGFEALVFGLVNDGITGVPGLLKLILKTEQGEIIDSGFLDAGYPLPSRVRQARMMLPKGMDWKGLRLYAEILVKGQLHPVEWACDEHSNADGSLTLKPTSYI